MNIAPRRARAATRGLAAYNGPSIPGTSVRPFENIGPEDLPASYAGTGTSVCWYEPPHPLSLPTELCDIALASSPTLTRSRHVLSPAFGAMTVSPRSLPVLWHVLAAVASANAFRDRVRWSAPVDLVLLRYQRPMSMPWHDDATAFTPTQTVTGLVLSAIVQLSDPNDYEGGTVEFDLGSGVNAMPTARGTVAVFPSSTRHRITRVTRGQRRSMTTFLPGASRIRIAPN